MDPQVFLQRRSFEAVPTADGTAVLLFPIAAVSRLRLWAAILIDDHRPPFLLLSIRVDQPADVSILSFYFILLQQ